MTSPKRGVTDQGTAAAVPDDPVPVLNFYQKAVLWLLAIAVGASSYIIFDLISSRTDFVDLREVQEFLEQPLLGDEPEEVDNSAEQSEVPDVVILEVEQVGPLEDGEVVTEGED